MRNSTRRPYLDLIAACCVLAALSGCGGGSSSTSGGGGGGPGPQSLGGSISGLNASGLVLANGGDSLSIASGAGSFTFATPVAVGAGYDVAVQTQPSGETCTVSQGSGTMPANAVSNVAVSCSGSTYAIGGTITGLGSATGLVLLDNGADATAIAANATTFTMKTRLTYGSNYQVTVGTQPGVGVVCTVSSGSGTADADVNAVAVSCGGVTLTQTAIARFFYIPSDVVTDAHGNAFVADTGNNTVEEIPYSNGGYGNAILVGSGFSGPTGVAVDTQGDVFVADTENHCVKEISYSNGSYGAPVIVYSDYYRPTGVAVDANGDVFVADSNGVEEVPYSGGAYGTPSPFGSGFDQPSDVAIDANGDVFVANAGNGTIQEVPYSGGSYGAPVTLASGIDLPEGIAVDASGNVFVPDQYKIEKIPNTGGSYGAPVVVGPTFAVSLAGIAVAPSGDLIVTDDDNTVDQVPASGGGYGASVAIGAGLHEPRRMAVDVNGDLFVLDANSGNGAIKEIPYSGGNYGAPVTINLGVTQPNGIAVDSGGNLFVTSSADGILRKIPYTNGSYGAPIALSGTSSFLTDIAVDAAGNVFAIDTLNNEAVEVPAVGGTPIDLAPFESPGAIAVDAQDDVFVTRPAYEQVFESIHDGNGGYGAATLVGMGFAGLSIGEIAVDAGGNIFVAGIDAGVSEVPYSNGRYGMPFVFAVNTNGGVDVAVRNGRLYVIDHGHIWLLAP